MLVNGSAIPHLVFMPPVTGKLTVRRPELLREMYECLQKQNLLNEKLTSFFIHYKTTFSQSDLMGACPVSEFLPGQFLTWLPTVHRTLHRS